MSESHLKDTQLMCLMLLSLPSVSFVRIYWDHNKKV